MARNCLISPVVAGKRLNPIWETNEFRRHIGGRSVSVARTGMWRFARSRVAASLQYMGILILASTCGDPFRESSCAVGNGQPSHVRAACWPRDGLRVQQVAARRRRCSENRRVGTVSVQLQLQPLKVPEPAGGSQIVQGASKRSETFCPRIVIPLHVRGRQLHDVTGEMKQDLHESQHALELVVQGRHFPLEGGALLRGGGRGSHPPSVHPSIHPSIHPPIHASTQLLEYLRARGQAAGARHPAVPPFSFVSTEGTCLGSRQSHPTTMQKRFIAWEVCFVSAMLIRLSDILAWFCGGPPPFWGSLQAGWLRGIIHDCLIRALPSLCVLFLLGGVPSRWQHWRPRRHVDHPRCSVPAEAAKVHTTFDSDDD